MYDVIIIGPGPAGLSAAVYTSRAQLKTLVFGNPQKSNLYKSHIIANYFGFPKDISGPDLTELGLIQAKKFGVEMTETEITDIIKQEDFFIVKDDRLQEYKSKTVIITTGQSFALSGIKNEKELTGNGVSYCVNCDGFFFKNKEVAVIGSGNYAAEEALQLTNYTKDITIYTHGKTVDINIKMKEELKKHQIELIETERITSFQKNNDKITIELPQKKYETNGVFMAVGTAGAVSFATKLGLEMDKNYIRVDTENRTSVNGIFAAGDCTGTAPQVAISVGSGCNAALSAIKFIRNLSYYIQYE
ncbi:NAD(P)/FAD-dependent oxidoreductase [Candidatus Peregrinibacteria bacterium]|nr:NAD(P)/FAD-dependent oxidoreductase [Candidatus Peregrinibacteria bacterium]